MHTPQAPGAQLPPQPSECLLNTFSMSCKGYPHVANGAVSLADQGHYACHACLDPLKTGEEVEAGAAQGERGQDRRVNTFMMVPAMHV